MHLDLVFSLLGNMYVVSCDYGLLSSNHRLNKTTQLISIFMICGSLVMTGIFFSGWLKCKQGCYSFGKYCIWIICVYFVYVWMSSFMPLRVVVENDRCKATPVLYFDGVIRKFKRSSLTSVLPMHEIWTCLRENKDHVFLYITWV